MRRIDEVKDKLEQRKTYIREHWGNAPYKDVVLFEVDTLLKIIDTVYPSEHTEQIVRRRRRNNE